MTTPSRPLAGPPKAKPLKYVDAAHTDIRKTFEKFRRLDQMRAKSSTDHGVGK